MVIRVEFARHKSRVLQLVSFTLFEGYAERLDRLRHHLAHHGCYSRRINAAGEEHSERNICHQAQTNRRAKQLGPFFNVTVITTPAFISGRELDIPESEDVDASILPCKCVARRQSPDAAEHGLLARRSMVRQIVRQHVEIELRFATPDGEYCLHLRGEEQ